MRRKNLMFGFLLMVGLGSAPCGVYAQNNPFEVGTVTPTQSVAAVEKYAINGSWVNVRSGPGTGNGVLKTLPRGSTGTKIAEKNGWLQIDFGNGLTGWVRADLVSKSGGATATVPAQSMNKLAAANAKQFARWEKHLGSDLLDFGRFPWYWKLNRANKAFKNGEYADAYKLAREASGNPLEAAYLQAMCLDKMGQHDAAAKLLAQLEKPFEDIVFTKKLDELAKPYVDEPIVFKFGGFDDIKTYQKKKAAGNDLGLNSGEYYEKYVDIKT